MKHSDVDRLHAHFIANDPTYKEAMEMLEASRQKFKLEPHIVANVKAAQIKYARHRAGLALRQQ